VCDLVDCLRLTSWPMWSTFKVSSKVLHTELLLFKLVQGMNAGFCDAIGRGIGNPTIEVMFIPVAQIRQWW